MKFGKIFFSVLFFYSLSINSIAESNNSPIAQTESTVTFHKARFTLLTPQLIRLEYSEAGTFEDQASLAIINRHLPTPKFSKKISGHQLTIETSDLLLTYHDDGKVFDADNLKIALKQLKNSMWKPGLVDTKNLKGTMRTLDQFEGWKGESKLENGLLSRSGWSLIDDSDNNLFDGDKEWNWVTQRQHKEIDWYFLGYGDDYKKALTDFTLIAGKIPLPPKYAFGYWWSRYWIYNDLELRNLVKQFHDASIPMDVLIIDMDWHVTYGFGANNMQKDPIGEWKGWTGYTWNKNLFPEPQKFIEWTNQQHLKTALNLHPASGVPTMEEKYSEFVDTYQSADYNNSDKKQYVPFLMSDKKWARTYFDVILKPMENWGIDFWWLDWQQFLYDKKITNLSNTWWLNYTFFSNMEKTGKRPMIFHRWGGLGNHRYPIGFSGDAVTTWDTLDFETYFTSTASNVGYSYWSHDIGGHINNGIPTDGELYLRWIQFGVLSPILRTHCSKISSIERRPWMFPNEFEAMRDSIQFRYQLAPYIYSQAYNTYETGVGLVHPLYYDYPKKEEAYSNKTEYFFGADMIAAPVTTPIDKNSLLAERKVWLPENNWFEWSSGEIFTGNQNLIRHYAKNEMPLFIKAGAIIPMNPTVPNLQEKINQQIIGVIPDHFKKNKQTSTEIYADDENTNAYQTGESAKRVVSTTMISDKQLLIRIQPYQGKFSGLAEAIDYDVKLFNRNLPSDLKISNAAVTASTEFDVDDLAAVIHLKGLKTSDTTELVVSFSDDIETQNRLYSGNKGFFKRMAQAIERMKYASAETDWGGTLLDEIYVAGNMQNRLRYHPEAATQLLQELQQQKSQLPETMKAIKNISTERLNNILLFLNLQ